MKTDESPNEPLVWAARYAEVPLGGLAVTLGALGVLSTVGLSVGKFARSSGSDADRLYLALFVLVNLTLALGFLVPPLISRRYQVDGEGLHIAHEPVRPDVSWADVRRVDRSGRALRLTTGERLWRPTLVLPRDPALRERVLARLSEHRLA